MSTSLKHVWVFAGAVAALFVLLTVLFYPRFFGQLFIDDESRRLIQLFEEKVFTEFRHKPPSPVVVVKWSGDVAVRVKTVYDDPIPFEKKAVEQIGRIGPELSRLMGLQVRPSDLDKYFPLYEIVVALVRPDFPIVEYARRRNEDFLYRGGLAFTVEDELSVRKIFDENKCLSDSVASVAGPGQEDRSNLSGSMQSGVVMVVRDLPTDESLECVTLQLVTLLGLLSEKPEIGSLPLSKDGSGFYETSLDQKILLRALYDPRIKRGMSRRKAMAIVRGIIPGLVAAVKRNGVEALYQN